MRIGVDFDNTIVCYDQLFHRVAVEQGLVPADLPVTKDSVRDYLRQQDQEEAWTELQGYVYGARMQEALPFPGSLEFFAHCAERGRDVWIISHKTRQPFRGPPHDLHEAARVWLDGHGFHDLARTGLSRDKVCFELTKEAKLSRIAQVACTHFVDDLPEFLSEPGFPLGVERILFDPNNHHVADSCFRRAASWAEVWELIVS